MLIHLSELFTLKGKEKTYTIDIDMDAYHGPNGDYEMASKEKVALRIVNLGKRRLELEGKAKLALMIPCDRCLDPVKVPLEFNIVRTLDFNESGEERAEEPDEQPYVKGYYLDADQLVCDELILNLPMKVLCSKGCKGICNRCGMDRNHEACDCGKRSLDPRMTVIQDIFKQFKEV